MMGVVPSLDEVEDRHACFGLGFEAGAVEQFTFQSGEKTLAHGVIETIFHRAHRGPHAASSQRLPKANAVYWVIRFVRIQTVVAT